ncbi:MAG: MoxR family ATPase [Cellulosilyticum sp.]|nr:MoxR family ATPase [Cellulosilyticum sp.]
MKYRTYAKELIGYIENEVKGKKQEIQKAVITLLAKGHLLIEDVPGVGKTTLAKALSGATDCTFNRIQFTPDTLPSDVVGVSIYNMQTGKFEFCKGAIMSQIVLADEINRTSPKTQASLLEAMEERQVTVDGVTYSLKEPFMVIATQNPIDYLGTYHLPEAQLDRFLMKLSMGYPSEAAEIEMVLSRMNHTMKEQANHIAVINSEIVCKMQQEVEQVEIHEDLVRYIIHLITATRGHQSLVLGASPRATLALVRAAQAKAYIENRDYVIPDDIIQMVEPVLSHRLVLTNEARMNKQTISKVLAEIVGRTKVPIF